MNLFVCYTHLQLVIASRIIAHRNLLPDGVELFYISKIDNDVTKNTLNYMRKICGKVNFIHMKLKYPLYFPSIFKHFFRRRYDSVFIASIDNILIHFILSRVNFDNLYTFDDGSANIIPGSIYYQPPNSDPVARFCRALLMIRYNILSIKYESQHHYTIYDGYDNVIPRTIGIDLLSSVDENSIDNNLNLKGTACNIIIGSVYSDIFDIKDPSLDLKNNLDKCWEVVRETGRDTFYLPHPREVEYVPPSNLKIIKAKYIAEQEILNLLKEYQHVYLYGFLSSCQINLACHPNVINRIFYSKKLVSVFNNAIKSYSHLSFEIINIDDEE
jgi:N-acetyllactosaminide alpha-2,3-sialyltransferase